MINLLDLKSFKIEYITITLMVIVSVVLLLTFFTESASIKDTITFSLVIVLLAFLTKDIKGNSTYNNSSNRAYKYIMLIFLFSFFSLF
jgi:hypothetical protein